MKKMKGKIMIEFERKLIYTEVKYGLIYIKKYRGYFPERNMKIDIYDKDGKKYTTKMHKTADRIDGLTKLYKNHKAEIGDIVIIQVKSNDSIKICFNKEMGFFKKIFSKCRLLIINIRKGRITLRYLD